MTLLRYSVLLMALVGVVSWVVWAIKFRRWWQLSIAPLSLLINIVLFYVVYYLDRGTDMVMVETLNFWSLIIRLQGLIMVIGAAVMMVRNANLFEKIKK